MTVLGDSGSGTRFHQPQPAMLHLNITELVSQPMSRVFPRAQRGHGWPAINESSADGSSIASQTTVLTRSGVIASSGGWHGWPGAMASSLPSIAAEAFSRVPPILRAAKDMPTLRAGHRNHATPQTGGARLNQASTAQESTRRLSFPPT